MNAWDNVLLASVDEEELNSVMGGKPVAHGAPWDPYAPRQRMRPHETGVAYRQSEGITRPTTLIVEENQDQRLFGRFAQLRSDFSPLSAWLHILSPRLLESADSPLRVPQLEGYDTAWAALCIAEAQLLTAADLPQVRIAACFATQSFAASRAVSLWPHLPLDEILRAHDDTRRLLRSDAAPEHQKIREELRPIWEILYELSNVSARLPNKRLLDLLVVIDRIHHVSLADGVEKVLKQLGEVLRPVAPATPLANRFAEISLLTPEQRLELFDAVVASISHEGIPRDSLEYIVPAFLAGLLSTIAAGGAPTLSLAESHSSAHPSILAWAYVVGSLGEKIGWTSSFEGLGRLVVRELARPLHLDEPPSVDFCYRELKMLVDPGLSDPLVHLRIKQSRTVNVALFPGVNVTFSLADAQRGERVRGPTSDPRPSATDDLMAKLADALVPHLLKRLGADVGDSTGGHKGDRKKRIANRAREARLPFSGPGKK